MKIKLKKILKKLGDIFGKDNLPWTIGLIVLIMLWIIINNIGIIFVAILCVIVSKYFIKMKKKNKKK